MPRLNWFRLYAEARNDRKLRTLTDSEHRVWFNLLCFASEQAERGSVTVDDYDIFALEVADGNSELLDATIKKLLQLRILTKDGMTLTFIHFMERQYDKPSDRPEATRERKQASRQHHASLDSSHATSRHVTPIQEERREEDKQTRGEDTPPESPPAASAAPSATADNNDPKPEATAKPKPRGAPKPERRLAPREDFRERMYQEWGHVAQQSYISDLIDEALNYYVPEMVRGKYQDIELCVQRSLRDHFEGRRSRGNGRTNSRPYQAGGPTRLPVPAARGPEDEQRRARLREKGFA